MKRLWRGFARLRWQLSHLNLRQRIAGTMMMMVTAAGLLLVRRRSRGVWRSLESTRRARSGAGSELVDESETAGSRHGESVRSQSTRMVTSDDSPLPDRAWTR